MWYTRDPMPAPPALQPNDDAPEAWIIQGRIEHYRTPIWDRLVRLSTNAYRLRVLGGTDHGRPFGSNETRDYLEDLPLQRRRGRLRPLGWDGLHDRVAHERPAVLVMNANPRNHDSWTIPRRAKQTGAAVLAWTKVHSGSRLPPPLANLLRRRLYARYDAVLTYGLQGRDELLALGVPRDRIIVTRNTIDTGRVFEGEAAIRARAEAIRAEHGLEGRRVVLYVGRMAADKRVRDLLAAWPRLRETDPLLTLALVGGGPGLEAIRREAADLDPAIVAPGRVPEGDDYAWIAAANVFVQCGAVGLAINQSLALGTPTVIADESGSDSEILEHGRTGRRYKKGDVSALIDAIRAAFMEPAATEDMVARGRRLLRDEVNVDRLAETIDSAIRRGLELSRKRRASA